MKILCLCGKTIGHVIAQFLLETPHTLRFVVNDYEKPGQWYRTPRELAIHEIAFEEAEAFNPDLIVVAFYDKILKGNLIAAPRLGAWNLHLGDAEKYRGAYPNVGALRNGDTTYAVTLHRIDAGIDTGPVLGKRQFPLSAGWTGKELYDRMVQEGRQLFVDSFPDLVSGAALTKARPQSNAGVVTHYRRELNREIEVSETVKNQVRSVTFPPFPPPFFMIGSRKFIVIEEPPAGPSLRA